MKPTINQYARYILEHVLRRKNYNGLTLESVEEALKLILTCERDPCKLHQTELALFINELQEMPSKLIHRASRRRGSDDE